MCNALVKIVQLCNPTEQLSDMTSHTTLLRQPLRRRQKPLRRRNNFYTVSRLVLRNENGYKNTVSRLVLRNENGYNGSSATS